MLKFSRSMMVGMTDVRRERFLDEYLPVVRRDFPELWVDQADDNVLQLLRAQCDAARALGLDSARGIYLLLTLRIAFGRDFPAGGEDAWARAILSRDGVGESDKLDAIETVCWGAPG